MIRTFNHITPTLGKDVFVDPSAIVTGDVHLDDDASVWPIVSIRGDLLPIKIGKRSNIQDGSVLHTTQDSIYNPGGFALTVGEDVTVGHQATLHGCTIGNFVLVGMGAIVLDGATVQDDVIIGAGTLVSPGKTLESGYLYYGNPVKQARALTDQEIEFLRFSSEKYVDAKNQHMQAIPQ